MSKTPNPPATLNPDMENRKMRRIFAEDLEWSLDLVPDLSKLCLESIVSNFEEKRIFEELTPKQKDYIQEKLSTSLPLNVTANLISDGAYWRRRCKEHWNHCDLSYHGHSWKQTFFERHLANIIEHFIPGVTEPKEVQEVALLCRDYVKVLDVTQLLPPIKEPQKEEEEKEEEEKIYELADNEEMPSMDHFDFNILLDKLTSLRELRLVYRVKQCGMNFEWYMFQMTDRDCESLAKALKSCKTLRIISLHQSQIEDKKCCLLVKHLLDHPSLRELDFSHNLIGDKGARAIGKLLSRNKLEFLNMSDNDIRGPGAKAIAHALSQNTSLLTLQLRLNPLKDEGGQAICKALLKNNTLRHLHLGASEVTWPTAITLSKVLVQNSTLRSINLSCNKVGLDGGKALEEAFSHNTSVTFCDIRLTEVSEQSASFIKQVVWANHNLELKRQAQETKQE